MARAVAEQVLEHGLRPTNEAELTWLLDAIEERLGDASPEDLMARFRFRFNPRRPDGFKHASTAFLTCTKRPLNRLEEAAAQPARGTPTPDRWQAPAAGPVVDDERRAELAAEARAAMRRALGGAS